MSILFGHRRSAAASYIPQRVGASGSFAEPVTAETAPQVVAYGSAVNLLSSLVGMLPVKVYNSSGSLADRVPALLDDPGGMSHGLGDWLQGWVSAAATSGNAVFIAHERDHHGVPIVLEMVDSYSVGVSRDSSGRLVWRINGKVTPASKVCHYRRFTPAGPSVLGPSPIRQFASTLGLAISAERFGAQWFHEGAHPSSVLQSEQPINQDTAERVKERVVATLRGSRGPAVLGSGLEYKPIQVSPEESQFLETQKFSSAQCARILGPGLAEVLGYPSGDSLTYATREQAAIDLLTYTVDPWLVGIEAALSRWIGGGRWVRFNRGALLRTDLKTRYEAHRISLGQLEPWQTANEVRDLEDMDPVDWGDERPATTGQTMKEASS